MEANSVTKMDTITPTNQFLTRMSRSGEYWSEAEEMKMIQWLQNGMTLKQVAEEHKRTRTAVKARLYQFAYELWREDITIENIAIVTTLDELHVKLAIESKSKKLTSNFGADKDQRSGNECDG